MKLLLVSKCEGHDVKVLVSAGPSYWTPNEKFMMAECMLCLSEPKVYDVDRLEFDELMALATKDESFNKIEKGHEAIQNKWKEG